MNTDRRFPYGNALDLLHDAICIVDEGGRYLYVSAAFETLFGYAPAEVIGRNMIDLVHPDDRAQTLQTAAGIVSGSAERHFENRYLRKDGRIVHIMWSARWSEAEQARIAVARDIGDRKRAEAMRLAAHAISDATHAALDLPALLKSIHHIVDGLLPAKNFFLALYDAQKDELSFPYYVDEFNAAPPAQRLEAGALCAEVIRSVRPLWIRPNSRMSQDLLARCDVGHAAIDWLAVPLQGCKGTLGAMVIRGYSCEVLYDEQDLRLLQFISTQVAAAIERKQLLARLEHAALYDPLTELPNYRLFQDRLSNALTLARREDTCLALLYLDLDQFKRVNDEYGHPAGDRLLKEVAARISSCVRESDSVARIGGDEFLVLLQCIQSPQDAFVVAETIRTVLGDSFILEGSAVVVSPSIGIAYSPEHGDDLRRLIRCADEAMYSAKRQGGNRSQFGVLQPE